MSSQSYDYTHRDSNFELLRIVAMLMVLALHANFLALDHTEAADFHASPLSFSLRAFWENIAIVGVNAFILISGWFGISTRRQSVMQFLFMLIFWRIAIGVPGALGCLSADKPTFSEIIKRFLPGYDDWFSLAYIILLFIAPFINTYSRLCSTRRLLTIALLFYAFELYSSWAFGLTKTFHEGYSGISLIGVYLIGMSMRRYEPQLRRLTAPKCLIAYIATASCATAGFILYTITPGNESFMAIHYFLSYTSPFVMAGAIFLFLCFLNIRIHNNTINRIARSTFAVYIIHANPYIIIWYKKIARELFIQLPTTIYILAIILYIAIIFSACILLDQLRIAAWESISKRPYT